MGVELAPLIQGRPRIYRGKAMSWSDKNYIKLLLYRPPTGADRWLIALRATADYYGWTEQFPTWSPEPIGTSGGYTLMREPGRRGRMYCESGVQLRISRDPSRRGHTPGKCNQFKVSASCTMFDLAELAYLTNEGWYWMSSPRGGRISRDEWLRMHEAGTQRDGRGLVSV